MIYLIRVTYYDNDTGEILDLLKIGYTKDLKSRMDSYLLHNPGCKLLETREGETDLESFFHSYYSTYSYNDRKEWFYYNQEIVDNFQTLEKGTYISKKKYIEKLREFIKKNISTPSQLRKKYMNSLLEEIKNTGVEKNQDFLYDEEFHISYTMKIWNDLYEKEIKFIDSYNFEELLKDLPNPINVDKNPWKNSATFYYRTTADYKRVSGEDFERIIDNKRKETDSLLRAFESVMDEDKRALSKAYQKNARDFLYKDDYVAVNLIKDDLGNMILKPVRNELVLVNELRSFKIQQIDYADRFTVFSTVHNKLTKDDIVNQEAHKFLERYNSFPRAIDKMRYLCESSISGTISQDAINIVLGQIPDDDYIKSYYLAVGPHKIKALDYRRDNIEKALGIVVFPDDLLKQSIYHEFKKGDKYTLADLKTRIGSLYSSINYNSTPKANDIERWFEVRGFTTVMEIGGEKKRVRWYELLEPKRNTLDEKYGN